MPEANPLNSHGRQARKTFPKEAGGLTALEVQLGWVEHHCDEHGFLVATNPRAVVNCVCRRTARIMRSGRLVNEETLKATDAKPRKLNRAGYGYRYGCDDCGHDFGGKYARDLHYVGRGPLKKCRPQAEFHERGLACNEQGRWVRQGPDPARFGRANTGLHEPGAPTRG